MKDVYSELDEAFDKLWEECGCPHAKDKTTNVKGNKKKREFNKLSNDKKADMAKEVIEPATGE